MRFFMAFFVVLLFLSCEDRAEDLGLSGKYMPSPKLLKKGLVWKYYVHWDEPGKSRKTDIQYTQYRINDGMLYVESYDAGFTLTSRVSYNIGNETWRIVELERVQNSELVDFKIIQPDFLSWKSNTSTSKVEFVDDGFVFPITTIQQNRSEVMNNTTSKMVFQLNVHNEVKGSQGFLSSWKETIEFTEGFGPNYMNKNYDGIEEIWELDEIMTSKEFEKRADHNMHRVAFIDPRNALDADSAFETCQDIHLINDYYNGGNERAGVRGGKGRIWRLLQEQGLKAGWGNESGYLNFRFVITCNNEVGRFITEEADLEFNKKEFSEKIRNRLFKFLSEQVEWEAMIFRGEPKDSYMYITFKLKDGEIIELLP